MRRGRTVGVLQARMSSSRLPGKVLKPLFGHPMIIQQLERIQRATTLSDVIVATSIDSTDDVLVDALVGRGYEVVRGPLDDVLARFLGVIDRAQPDNVVRMTADCPLICPSVIDLVVRSFHESDADYASNTLTPTYPDGLDVEIFSAAAMRELAKLDLDHHEREHVTLGIYRRPERFALRNVADPTGADRSDLRWTVDTIEDFDFVQALYAHIFVANREFDYLDILEIIEQHPDLTRTIADAPRNAALDGIDTGAMQGIQSKKSP